MSKLSKRTVWNEVRDVLILIGVSVFMTVSGIGCRNCTGDTRTTLIMILVTSSMWVLLWKGNEKLATYLSNRISWIEFPVRRFVIGLTATILYTVLVIYGVGMIFGMFFEVRVSSASFITLVITIAISLFMHARSFLLNWRQTTLEVEQYQQQSIMARYESLKSQVSPHFLFNNLNALTHLVYEDKEKARRFVSELSRVYQYVMETRDREVVSVAEELEFVHAYLYLQQIRFADKLRVVIKERADGGGFVPPLSVQMLLENAIKHNVVSQDDPLHVEIAVGKNSVIVENNVQLKLHQLEPSSGVGLENIRRRYEFLSQENIVVFQDKNIFRVTIPLLERRVSPGTVPK